MNKGRIGIDLGNSYCCCGVVKENRTQIIPYSENVRTISSCVYYNPKTPEITVGKYNIKLVGQVVFDLNRLLGRKFKDPELQEDIKHWPFKVIEGKDGEALIELEYNNEIVHLTPTDVITEILKKIKETADIYLDQDTKLPTEAVIIVPSYFNNEQREKIVEAAKNANLKVFRLVNGSISAGIAYSYQRFEQNSKGDKEETMLIYDFGGDSFEVSIIRIDYKTKNIKVLGSNGVSHLGGEDIDYRLVDYYHQLYKDKTGKELNSKNLYRLKKECESSKWLLSSEGNDEVVIDFNKLADADIDTVLRINEFNRINMDIFNKTIDVVDSVIKDSKLKNDDIDYIVLVGGSSRNRKVSELLKNKYPNSVLCKDANPDVFIGLGSCIYANLDNFHMKVDDLISQTTKYK